VIRSLSVASLCLLTACAGARKAPLGPEPPPKLLRCFLLKSDDFSHGRAMDRLRPYRDYLDWLIRSWGVEYGLTPRDVRLYASYAPAPTRPGRDGPVAGEIVCHHPEEREDVGRYRIVLYREALLGHDVSRLYNTIAHEFKHVLQDAAGEGAVDCGRIAKASALRHYEKEASRWADRIAPLTDCGTRNR
jgi:hypothetical protein